MKLALEQKLYLDFHWITRPWRRTLTNEVTLNQYVYFRGIQNKLQQQQKLDGPRQFETMGCELKVDLRFGTQHYPYQPLVDNQEFYHTRRSSEPLVLFRAGCTLRQCTIGCQEKEITSMSPRGIREVEHATPVDGADTRRGSISLHSPYSK